MESFLQLSSALPVCLFVCVAFGPFVRPFKIVTNIILRRGRIGHSTGMILRGNRNSRRCGGGGGDDDDDDDYDHHHRFGLRSGRGRRCFRCLVLELRSSRDDMTN